MIIEPQVDPRMRNAKTPTSMNKVGIIVNGRKKRSERENVILGSRIRLQHDEPREGGRVVEEVVRDGDDPRRVQRQHAPRDPFPLRSAREVSVPVRPHAPRGR